MNKPTHYIDDTGEPIYPKGKVNKPAFPCVRLENHKGMTMRQWYKGMALNLLANDNLDLRGKEEEIIKSICLIADAMLKEDEENEV